MASTTPFYQAVASRASIYTLENSIPFPDSKVHEVVTFAIKHCPSALNVQSARAVILFSGQHQKFWDLAHDIQEKEVPSAVFEGHLKPRLAMYRGAYGTVMFFEDHDALAALQQKNPMVKDIVPEWSEHSTGMHQFTVWTALEAEGLGCNLQHYNYSPAVSQAVLDEWKLPAGWKLKAQLVFGTPKDGKFERSGERTYLPLEDRIKVFGGDVGV